MHEEATILLVSVNLIKNYLAYIPKTYGSFQILIMAEAVKFLSILNEQKVHGNSDNQW